MPGGHQRAGGAVGQPHHAGDHLAFLGLQHAALVGFGKKAVDLLFRHPVHGSTALAKKPEEHATGAVEEPDERGRDDRQEGHRRGHADRDAFSVAQCHLLRDQFAHDQADIGDHDHYTANTKGRGQVGGQAQGGKPGLQTRAKGCPGQRTGQDTDRSDTDLYGREEPSGMLGQPQGHAGTTAFGLQRSQPGGTGADDGKLGHRKHAVEDDQGQDDEDFTDHDRVRCGRDKG